jgi:hypothetical protein
MEERSDSLPSFMKDLMRALPRGHRNSDEDRPHQDGGEGTRWAGAGSERLQFLAGLEAHSFAGRDADFLARAGIAADAGLARAYVEHAEAAQLDPFSLAESALHGPENCFDGLFRLGPGHPGLVHYCVYYVQLDHASLPLPQRQAMLDTQLRVVKLHALGQDARRTDPQEARMPVKPDCWIRKMALEHKMIEPFEDRQVGDGVISYGVSSHGYDIRVADEFRIFTNVNSTIKDLCERRSLPGPIL